MGIISIDLFWSQTFLNISPLLWLMYFHGHLYWGCLCRVWRAISSSCWQLIYFKVWSRVGKSIQSLDLRTQPNKHGVWGLMAQKCEAAFQKILLGMPLWMQAWSAQAWTRDGHREPWWHLLEACRRTSPSWWGCGPWEIGWIDVGRRQEGWRRWG